MVRQRLAEPDTRAGFLLDGFPRTVEQAGVLTEILAAQGRALDAMLDHYAAILATVFTVGPVTDVTERALTALRRTAPTT